MTDIGGKRLYRAALADDPFGYERRERVRVPACLLEDDALLVG